MESEFVNAKELNWGRLTVFLLMHLIPFALIWTGATWVDWTLCFGLYFLRMFFITAGYHRYFAHRSYKMGRVMQFIMALGATLAIQQGPLWWAGHHRHHHWFSDMEEDLHSPIKGFLWSHFLWIYHKDNFKTPEKNIRDFSKYPELRFLDEHWLLPPVVLAVILFLLGGWSMLVVSFFISTLLLYHGTFAINSVAHVFGGRRFATNDTSRNSLLLALVTLGEGWHNNHHHFQASTRQGFYWWEVDVSFYILKVMSWLGLVWDLNPVPESALKARRIKEVEDTGMQRVLELYDKYLPKLKPLWPRLLNVLTLAGSIAALVLLVVYGAFRGGAGYVVGVSLFGGLLVLYVLFRNLEAFWKKGKVRELFAEISNVNLYLLVAAAYTPLLLSLPQQAWAWSLFGVMWGIALAAFVLRLTLKKRGLRWLTFGFGAALLVLHFVGYGPVVQVVSAEGLAWFVVAILAFVFAFYSRPYLRQMQLQPVYQLLFMVSVGSHFWFLLNYV